MPAHPRITAHRYSRIAGDVYNQRLAPIDLLVLPYNNEGTMLITGVTGDAIGVWKPVLASVWPYLMETFGAAALVYGNDAAGLAGTLEALDVGNLEARAAVVGALQPRHTWEVLAEKTLALHFDVLRGRRSGGEVQPLVAPAVSPET